METLGLFIHNLDQTRSRRNYNCYRANYPTIYAPSHALKPVLVIETYVALLPFPTTLRMADNYIYRFLKIEGQEHLAERYGLMPFVIETQAVERTLVDKVFAICDYYLSGKVTQHSRHLYDIHKIMENITTQDNFPSLVKEVRKVRSALRYFD